MKNIVTLFCLSVILFSCSSKTKKIKSKIEKVDREIEGNSIKESDTYISSKVKRSKLFDPYKIKRLVFKKIKRKKINKELDYYKNSISRRSLLGNETLNLFSKFDFSKIKLEIKDPISLSLMLCYQKKYKDGFDKLDRIFFKYSNSPRYWNSIASCYFLSGEYRKSDLYLNKALSLDKKFVPSINNLGVLNSKRKLYKKSFELFHKSSKINSFSITPILNKAQLLLKFNLIEKACPIFRSLYSEDAFNKDIGHGYGTCLLFNEKPFEAYSVYKNLKVNYKEDEIPFVHYLLSLKLMGRFNEINKLITGLKVNFKTKYARRMFDFVRTK